MSIMDLSPLDDEENELIEWPLGKASQFISQMFSCRRGYDDDDDYEDESEDQYDDDEEALDELKKAGVFDSDQGKEALEQLWALAEKGVHPMALLSGGNRLPQEQPMDPVLGSFDLEGVARYIQENECKRVVVMCGAGLSTSAGIPDFRTPGTGLYDNLQRFNLPVPEAIFELNFFRKTPAAFYELCKDIWPGNYEPTPAHYFIKMLSDKGILLRCYSQNIDSLETRAGLPREKLVAAHGNFDAAHVIDTYPEVLVDIDEVKAAIDKGEEGWQALREEKGNLVKPKITFFGEELPARFVDLCGEDFAQCDALIVLGTSLVVAPFCTLVGMAAASAPRVLINREPAGTCDMLELGFRFQKEANWRDVFHAGDCDTGCRTLAKALGWESDLESLISSRGAASVERAPWATGKGAAVQDASP
jgi:NAD-dependent deacetylase sirtuin 2